MKCPYSYPHKSREAKAKYLSGIGGYYSRDGRFPIEFTVGTYYAKLDFDTLWAHILKEYHSEGPDPEENRLFKEACAKVYGEVDAYLWDWALEDIRRDIDPGEGDTYFMLWDGTKIDAALELHGRCGKHLVIAGFNGIKLESLTEDDLYTMLTEQQNAYGDPIEGQKKLRKGYEWSVSSSDLDLLYRYVRQCEVDFTSQNASNQLECMAAWHVYSRAEDELENMRTAAKEKAALQNKSKLLYDALDLSDEELREAWRDLCIAAGLTPSDIMY